MERLNIVSTGAIALMSPSMSPAAARPKHRSAERRGSSFAPKPRPKTRGISRSRASAWKTRGAQRKLPTALESVAAHTPSRIANGQRAHFWRIIVSVRRIAASETNA